MLKRWLQCLQSRSHAQIAFGSSEGAVSAPCISSATTTPCALSAPECAICLDTEDGPREALSRCGHMFHTSCLERAICAGLKEGRGATCPLCKDVLAQPATERDIRRHDSHGVATPLGNATREGQAREVEAHRTFIVAARRIGLRACPSCGQAIENSAGCNTILCRCGQRFDWSRARPVALCCGTPHFEKGVWGAVCSTCPPIAKTLLSAWRVGLIAAGAMSSKLLFKIMPWKVMGVLAATVGMYALWCAFAGLFWAWLICRAIDSFFEDLGQVRTTRARSGRVIAISSRTRR